MQDQQTDAQAEAPQANASTADESSQGAGRHGAVEAAVEDSVADSVGPIDEQPAAPDVENARAASPEPANDWAALDRYRDQLRADHSEWSERLTTVRTQLASVAPALAGIAAQYQALAVEDDLARLRESVLGGAGMIQRVQFDFDLERAVTLAWPAAADPRPALASPEGESEYRVDCWFGLGPDGRARVRVEGAKRLEAPLPTSRERLRGALRAAIQAPRVVSRAEAMAGTAPDFSKAGDSSAATAGSTAAESAPEHSEGAPAQPEPAAASQPGQEPQEARPVPEATPRPGDPTPAMPPEEMVIPLGPAEERTPA